MIIVSVFILTVVVALAALAALVEVEGDASGAVDWRPLKTMARVIPLLVELSVVAPFPIDSCLFFFPPETAAGAIGSSAAPLAGIWSKNLSIAMAGLWWEAPSSSIISCICAGVPAPPIAAPP